MTGALTGPVSDHLVHVGVRRRARPGLEDVDRELIVQPAGDDLPCHSLEQAALFRIEPPESSMTRLAVGKPSPEPVGFVV